ncbi:MULTISPECIES: YopX family protein [Thermoanaerobacterium]|uniref:YopX protein domain-containing protein n=2 Tax=Thermoanaerobacterium TaxID=28895 RepID=W9E9P8_9THEO|nr:MULTISPECIES: YopX family protein [Thermoanaerobacterium]AFK87435.1 Conserved hypothetical protein CHP01671 [Thermoanaerobacterium saccharolyticum JW/SL-YS485]ETO37806.1 hypothetical protein V518_2060 [Thermoanaerobacterium aotearoense SCUT27]
MREIKFRVWDKRRKMWLGDTEVCMYGDGSIYVLGDGWQDITNDDNYEIVRYTGLKDKTKKEIYERDILRCKIWNPMSCERDCVLEVVVIWDQSVGSWEFKDIRRKFANVSWIFIDDVEIIGNIYQNPELLKEE